jgi:phosphoserine phosphatase
MNTKKRLVLCDLDGTLVSCNTFHKWLKYTAKNYLINFKIIKFIKIIFYSFLRLIRLITHKELKIQILKISQNEDDLFVDNFVKNILIFLNLKVIKLLETYFQENYHVIMITAAPEVYANKIGKKIGFDMVIASPNHNGDKNNWQENIREQKLISLNNNIDISQFESIEVLSDHYDDLPILKIATKCILVSPSKKTIEFVKKAGITCIERIN